MSRRIRIDPKISHPNARAVATLSANQQRRHFEAALQDCQEALQELEQARARWTAYEERDVPAYFAWLHATFADELGELRKLYAELEQLRATIDAVTRLVRKKGMDPAEAYQLVQEQEERAKQDFKKAFDENHAHKADADSDEAAARASAHAREREAREAPPVSERPAKKPEGELLHRLKALYRGLVRRLHPDVNDHAEDTKARAHSLWLQVQEAYAASDLERLHALSAMAEQLGGSSEAQAGLTRVPEAESPRLAELKATAAKYRRAARKIDRELGLAKREDPAYGFIASKKDRKQRERAEDALEEERMGLMLDLDLFRSTVLEWSLGARVRRTRRGGRGRSRR